LALLRQPVVRCWSSAIKVTSSGGPMSGGTDLRPHRSGSPSRASERQERWATAGKRCTCAHYERRTVSGDQRASSIPVCYPLCPNQNPVLLPQDHGIRLVRALSQDGKRRALSHPRAATGLRCRGRSTARLRPQECSVLLTPWVPKRPSKSACRSPISGTDVPRNISLRRRTPLPICCSTDAARASPQTGSKEDTINVGRPSLVWNLIVGNLQARKAVKVIASPR
jgi:hypothetical protein